MRGKIKVKKGIEHCIVDQAVVIILPISDENYVGEVAMMGPTSKWAQHLMPVADCLDWGLWRSLLFRLWPTGFLPLTAHCERAVRVSHSHLNPACM